MNSFERLRLRRFETAPRGSSGGTRVLARRLIRSRSNSRISQVTRLRLPRHLPTVRLARMRGIVSRSRIRVQAEAHALGSVPDTGGHREKRVIGQFMVGALLLLASAASLDQASAEEEAVGWFDRIAEFFKPPENTAVDVPLRRKSTQPSPDAPPDSPPESRRSAQPSPSPAPVAEPQRERSESEVPMRPVNPTDAPEHREAEPPTSASTPAEAPRRLEGVEPSHVYRAVQDLIAEVNILREELGVSDVPPEAELLEDRAPVHVYAKTLEVLAKVTGAQHRLEVPVGRVGQIPFREIDAADLLANIEYILRELGKIKTQMGIQRQITPAPLEAGKTSSMIYKSLADASFLLDALRGQPLTPDDVYWNAMSVLDEVSLIAEKLEVPLERDLVAVEGTKKPVDVAQQVLRATYKAINLQTRLEMDASRAPAISLVRVTLSENYDGTNLLLAEMARIKLHLGIDKPRDDRSEQPRGRSPNDVFALIHLIVRNLDRLSTSVRG